MLPSVKTISDAFRGLDRNTCKKIRQVMEGKEEVLLPENDDLYRSYYNPPKKHERIMDTLNKLIGGFGTEVIRCTNRSLDRYWGDIAAEYINTGDTYSSTILYDVERQKFYVTTWGDWVKTSERNNRYKFG